MDSYGFWSVWKFFFLSRGLQSPEFRTRPGGWGCTKLKVLGGIVCAIMYAIVRCVHTLLRGTWRHSRSSHWYRSDACAPGTCYTVARSLWSLTGSRHTARSLWSLSGFRYTARSSFWSLLGLCHTIVRSLWSLSGFRYTARSSFWSLLGLSEKKKKNIYIHIRLRDSEKIAGKVPGFRRSVSYMFPLKTRRRWWYFAPCTLQDDHLPPVTTVTKGTYLWKPSKCRNEEHLGIKRSKRTVNNTTM